DAALTLARRERIGDEAPVNVTGETIPLHKREELASSLWRDEIPVCTGRTPNWRFPRGDRTGTPRAEGLLRVAMSRIRHAFIGKAEVKAAGQGQFRERGRQPRDQPGVILEDQSGPSALHHRLPCGDVGQE